MKGEWENFLIQPLTVEGKEVLLVAGSDARGAAYGLLELSRSIGVFPWSWWADVAPQKKENALWSKTGVYFQSPSVQYRGIFLNDEDWALVPWSTKTFEPSTRRGEIGPKTYAKIFELLLRLRANTVWPAMHECTVPFYFVPGNREMADKYGIIMGTSHCEPMMRNSASEWNEKIRGAYNFVTNSDGVIKYWKERLHELKNAENIYTIGMRGRHDGRMQGVTTIDNETEVLQKVINIERELLKNNINSQVEKIPQIFVPYKEVLKVYNNGLKVPDDVILMWTDDNYGYITRLGDADEQRRKGGAGVYYHVSYWGSPHDYLWLASTQPGLIYQEMKRAWDNNARKIWILNVGDIKPAEYLTEFFLDLAWNINSIQPNSIRTHLASWVSIQFPGFEKNIARIMNRYYDMAAQRKPEHMRWFPNENGHNIFLTEYNPYVFGDEIEKRIAGYEAICDASQELYGKLPQDKRSAYYQLVHYPVLATAAMNKKFLYAQKANQLATYKLPVSKEYARLSQEAYDKIVSLTDYYNKEMQGGKWNGMMSMKPRNLAVFKMPPLPLHVENQLSEDIVLWVEGSSVPLWPAQNKIVLPDFTLECMDAYFFVAYTKNGKKPVYLPIEIPDGFSIVETPSHLQGETKWTVKAAAGMKPGEYRLKIKINQTPCELSCKVRTANTLLSPAFIERNKHISFDAVNQKNGKLNKSVIESLGHSGQVLVLPHSKDFNSKQYAEYKVFTFSRGDFKLFVGSIPVHPRGNGDLRYAVVIDDQPAVTVSTKASYRSKEWNERVMRNQLLSHTEHTIEKPGMHTIRIYALDEDMYLDQIMLDFDLDRKFYVIPSRK